MLLNSEFMFFRLVPFLSAKKMSLLGVKVKGGWKSNLPKSTLCE
jgi:hypothetical protein